ncbi:hypothetical protein [Rhizobium sp. SG741]|uniref:hypothetical protein n=1 Tax=Rhizobium sp. SG741 TaxID=2587114 RepID=UPI0014453475|nr:hypothetical protein [Rhizobium sp. SG741]NKJ03113.1 ribosome-binding protein aMBF1 (putative translation factor) [Rhizobium sp. SG741]
MTGGLWGDEFETRVEAELATSSAADRVRKMREERGIGMLEAKRIVMREELIADIEASKSIDDIKALLLRIV